MTKYVVIGALAVLVIACACGAVFFWYLLVRELPTLDAELSIPSTAVVGEPIEMRVITSNSHSESLTLGSIDIDGAFLAGFQVLGIDPEATGTFHIPVIDQRSWSFDKPVPTDERLVVTFDLRCINAGHFTGNIDACNPNNDCASMFVDVVTYPKQ